MQIKYMFSEKYLQEEFVQTGLTPDLKQILDVEPQVLSKESRQMLVDLGIPIDAIEVDFCNLRQGRTTFGSYKLNVPPPDADNLIASYKAALDEHLKHDQEKADEELRQNMAKANADFDRYTDPRSYGLHLHIPSQANAELKKEAQQLKAKLEAEREKRGEADKAARLERERAQKAEREQRRAEKALWIAEHGSDHLKESTEAGYDCQRLYVKERAALEFPEYTLDFDDKAAWNSRSCPSPEALAEAKRVNGEVVWLSNPSYKLDPDPYDPYEYPYDEPWEEREAVVISNYLAYQHYQYEVTGSRGYTLIREF